METMSIIECEDKAKDEGYNCATFDLVSPAGVLQCRWLDAYMGIFQVEGQKGFVTVGDVKRLLGLRCANFAVPATVPQEK